MDKLLRQFLTVAEMKSLSHAAKKLFITQPTLTHNMKKLEDDLGVPLLIRSSKGVALTAYGDLLMEQARVMRRVHDNAMAELSRFHQQRERGMRLGVGLAWWHLFFRDLLRDYRTAHPLAPLHVEMGNHLRTMDQLLSGDIDLFVGHQIVGLNERSGALFMPLFRCLDGVFARADHPLVNRTSVAEADLLDYPHLDVTPDESRYGQVVKDPAAQTHHAAYHRLQRVVWSTSSMSAGIEILLESDAVMTYASSMAPYFQQMGLAELAIAPSEPAQVGIYCLAERQAEASVQHMIGLIQTAVGQLDLSAARLLDCSSVKERFSRIASARARE